jgi:hypothetical protein
VDREHRVAGVVLAGEEPRLLEALDLRLGARQPVPELGQEVVLQRARALLLTRQLREAGELLDVLEQPAVLA